MTSNKRWKLACVVLAACTAYSWVHRDGGTTAAQPRTRVALDRPVRINAATLGISSDDLVQRLLHARTVGEVQILTEKLGMVGDDAMIDAVMPLVADTREGVPALVLGAFGEIGTDHAVDVLVARARADREEVRLAAIDALGTTANPRAEKVLLDLAGGADEAVRMSAIGALGKMGSERAVDVLAKIAIHPGSASKQAIEALAKIDTAPARAAIVKLIDAPSTEVASAALDAITVVDDALFAKLKAIASNGESDLMIPVIHALSHAGDDAIPTLTDAARHGPKTSQEPAVQALAALETPAAFEALRELLETAEGDLPNLAAGAIAKMGTEDARELLISAALSDRAEQTHAVEHLMQIRGADVEQALLAIAKSGTGDRDRIIAHLVELENQEATKIVLDDARGGSLEAMQLLARRGNQAGVDLLVALARSRNDDGGAALKTLADARPDDATVRQLLREQLRGGPPASARVAAEALAALGTDEARDALLDAAMSSNLDLAGTAVSSLAKFRLSGATAERLRSIALAHPELAGPVMDQLISAGGPTGIQMAESALRGSDRSLAERALSAIERVGITPATFDVLARGMSSSDESIRGEALRVMAASRDPRATEHAVQALRDAPSVRHTAINALGQMDSPRARSALIDVSRSADQRDRYSAARYLHRYEDASATQRLAEMTRDSVPYIASVAMTAMADRTGGMATIRAVARDASVSASVRLRAAYLMRDRDQDPSAQRLIDQLSNEDDY